METLIGLALTLFFIAGGLVFAVVLQIGIGSVTERAMDITDERKQIREQEAQRAQEPQNVLLRAGMTGDAQPETLVRPAMAGEETAPQTLLRPVGMGEHD